MDKTESVENKDGVTAPAIHATSDKTYIEATMRTSFWEKVLYTYLIVACIIGSIWIFFHVGGAVIRGVMWFPRTTERIETIEQRMEYTQNFTTSTMRWGDIPDCKLDGKGRNTAAGICIYR